MLFDDDSTEPLGSSREKLERADGRKNERQELRRKIQSKERQKRELQKLKLKMHIEKQKSEQTPGTKTREEQIQQETQRADMKMNPDRIIEEGKRQEARQEQASYEEEQKLP